jgi:hypothetical protein
MGNFLHKYNTDNVHSRSVIVGMINLLNSRVFFENVLADDDIDTVYVPFFYNMGGDERFLQDYFFQWNDCVHPRHADGNYDVIPRGVVTLTAKNIDTSKMTHRFVRGNYVKEVNGELQTFSAYLNSIPMTMTFDVEVELDTYLDSFKVEQSLIETFYKTQVYSVNFRGFRVPCQVGFPEDFGVNKTFEFTYQSNVKPMLKFSLTVETYYPVVDSSTERSNANRATGGYNTPLLSDERYTVPRFTFDSPKSQEKYFSGSLIPITWVNTGPIQKVNLYYRLSGSPDWILIAENTINNGRYDWSAPFIAINGVLLDNDPVSTVVNTDSGSGAKVRAIIDSTGAVDKIVILEPGSAYSAVDTILCSTPNAFTPPVIQASIVEGAVIDANIVSGGSGFTPSPLHEIEIKIEDTNSELNYQVLDQNITFVGNTNVNAPSPANTYITNVVPTVIDLLAITPLIGQSVNGAGISTDSLIINVNPATNTIEINNTVTNTTSGGTITTSTSVGKIYLQ